MIAVLVSRESVNTHGVRCWTFEVCWMEKQPGKKKSLPSLNLEPFIEHLLGCGHRSVSANRDMNKTSKEQRRGPGENQLRKTSSSVFMRRVTFELGSER